MTDAESSEWSAYLGWYAMFGFACEVREQNGELVAAVPGVPPGYEIVMQPLGRHQFRLLGGPVLGAVATARLAPSGQAEAIVIGTEELARVPAGQVPPPASYENLQPPPMLPDAARDRAFETLLQSILERRDGSWIDYSLSYPKHEFLRYASDRQVVLFHGSGRADIDEFLPRRTSFELRDASGRGNHQAVYATHDGLWPMFFAVVDRARITGSIRNGVTYYHNRAGEPLALYHFSINRDDVGLQPWRTGTLYFLPRDTFFQIPLAGEALSNEWASPVAVKPLGRLGIEPEDFPFLHQIGGHDDSMLLRFEHLYRQIVTAVTEARPVSGGLVLILNWTPDLADDLPEFLELQRTLLPAASFDFAAGSPARLMVLGPAAFLQVLRRELAEHLGRPVPEDAAGN